MHPEDPNQPSHYVPDVEPRVGDDVLFVLDTDAVRPAKVVRVWSPECANLVVFCDGSGETQTGQAIAWVTSVPLHRSISQRPLPGTFYYRT